MCMNLSDSVFCLGRAGEVNTQPRGQIVPINSFYFHLACGHVIIFYVLLSEYPKLCD